MKLGTFRYRERVFPGLLEGDEVYDLTNDAVGLGGIFDLKGILTKEGCLERLIEGKNRVMVGSGIVYNYNKVRTMAPILNPGKIICIGRNYLEHAKETGVDLPTEPVFFNKFATSIIGPQDSIVLPKISQQVDYEAELAIIIGKRGKFIREEQALTYIAGYTVFNDVSARDLQFKDGQWVKGKGLDTFAPMGPFLITADEIGNAQKLSINLWLNGNLMQESNTEKMIFNIPQLISYLSDFFTLEPGDVIATGTPSGVGFARKPQIFLKSGDQIKITIEKVGELNNSVK